MKFKIFAAAALAIIGASPMLAAPAAAAPVAAAVLQRTVVHERTVVRHDGPRFERRGHRDRVKTRRVCTNRWRHGERQRVCRTVRRYR